MYQIVLRGVSSMALPDLMEKSPRKVMELRLWKLVPFHGGIKFLDYDKLHP